MSFLKIMQIFFIIQSIKNILRENNVMNSLSENYSNGSEKINLQRQLNKCHMISKNCSNKIISNVKVHLKRK